MIYDTLMTLMLPRLDLSVAKLWEGHVLLLFSLNLNSADPKLIVFFLIFFLENRI